MNKRMKRLVACLSLAVLLMTMVYFPPAVNAANEFYGNYTDVAKIYDYGSCPSMQGLAVGSQMLYSVKINSGNTKAFISMTDKDTGTTTRMYNADAGSYYFDYLGHANDMDVWGIDGASNLFVATTNKGAQSVVRLKRSGSNLTKVAQYRLVCNGSDICATALSIMSVSGGQIKLLTKWGMDLYTGTVSTSATSATVEMTKLCTISKSRVYIKGSYLDLSGFVNQGMGYYQDTLYVPITGDDSCLNRSVIMVFDLSGVATGSTIYPTEALVFRVTSGAYSALFEIESCDISSGDKKLYFSTNRRKTTSDTNHDGVSSMNDYTFERIPVDAPTSAPTYTIRYNANGGTGTMADTVVTYGIAQKLQANAFTREGYVFRGWTAYRTAKAQWYYTNGSSSGWYAEGSQPVGYTKYIYKDCAGVAKTTSVDGDVVQLYAQWEANPDWTPEPTLPTGTIPAHLDRVDSAAELQEGVPYVISDYKDSWLHYVLTTEAAQKVSGSKTHSGFLLDGTPSVDTPYRWYIKDGYLVYGSADSDEYLLICYDASSQGVVELGSFDAANAATVVAHSGDDFAIRGSKHLNRHGGTASDYVATAYTSAGGSYWHLDRVVGQQTVTLSLPAASGSICAGGKTTLAPEVQVAGSAADAYEISWSCSDSSVANVSASGTVTGLKAGEVTVTATLTAANGQSLTSPITATTTLTVEGDSNVVTTVQEATLEKVSALQTGIPYVITEKNSGAALTGTMLYKTDTGYAGLNGLQGLKTVPTVDLSDAPVWYYDGTHLRYGSPTGSYLVYDPSNQVALGTASETNIFDKVTLYSSSNKTFNISPSALTASTSSYYLNQMGGSNYNVVGLYSSAYYSQWHFSHYQPQRTVSLSVASLDVSLDALATFPLSATVSVDGSETRDYALTWSSSNSSVASVTGGVIEANGAGTAVITGTLTEVDGRALDEALCVEVSVQVTDAGYTATAVQPAKLVKTTTLETGVPYVITEKNSGASLSGTMVYTTDADYAGLNGTQGLKTVSGFAPKDAPVWYYDGTYLRYGAPTGTDNYLVYNSSGQVALGTVSEANIFDKVTLYSSSNKTFTVYPSNKSSGSTNYYLNQLGGANYNATGLYTYAPTSQWHFSQLVSEKDVSLNVSPSIARLTVGKTADLTAAVTVNGVSVTDCQLTWTTSNSAVATVTDGTITAVGSGDVTITVTLTGAEGDTFATPLSIQIPLTVVA